MGLSSNFKSVERIKNELVLQKAGQNPSQIRIMMRITADTSHEPPVLKLEGNLAGPWVTETETAWGQLKKDHPKERLIVNLAGVTFVDGEGKMLLARMFQLGAEFSAAHGLTKYIVERIQQESESSQK